MQSLKSAKLYFCFAVLLLVAKPFLGFSLFSRIHPPAEENIFVKAFNKRKQEYTQDSHYDIIAIQKKLADPVQQFILRFSFLLNIIFSAIFIAGTNITDHFLNEIRLSLSLHQPTWLLNGKLII
jgi:hypothetical protein